MRLTLPSAIVQVFCACSHPQAPVPPGPPIPAEPEIVVGAWEAECKALTAAIDTYSKCPNLDEDDRAWLRATIDFADQSWDAAKKTKLDDGAQRAIAVKCKRAASSVHFATVRCEAGPKPRVDY